MGPLARNLPTRRDQAGGQIWFDPQGYHTDSLGIAGARGRGAGHVNFLFSQLSRFPFYILVLDFIEFILNSKEFNNFIFILFIFILLTESEFSIRIHWEFVCRKLLYKYFSYFYLS